MLEINIKLVPYGIKDREHEISRVTIWNDATGTHEVGNYGYKIVDGDGTTLSGKLTKFNRKKGALKLLKEILNKAI